MVSRGGTLFAGAQRRSGNLSSQPLSSVSESLRIVMVPLPRPSTALSGGVRGGNIIDGGGGGGGPVGVGRAGGGGAPLEPGARGMRTYFAAPFEPSSSKLTRASWPVTSITIALPALLLPAASANAGSSVPGTSVAAAS